MRGDARAAAPVNAAVYASAVLQSYFGALVLWEVASPGDVHLSWPVDVAFYLVLGLGILVLAVAAFRTRAPGGR